MSKAVANEQGKVKLSNKLAFACGDIFGGGSFNIINFLFVPFLTLVVGIDISIVGIILLFTKIWDGIIDPFIGKVTDGKQPGKFGKRRYFMLIFAPLVAVGLVLLFFPWNLVTKSVPLKILFVIIVYMLYATAQSFVLIPYYSHASEMTANYSERNKVNAVRLAFSIASSLICVVVPGMLASPEIAIKNQDGGLCYIVMAAIFGVIFMASILVTAIFSKEQIVSPAIHRKLSFKEFVKPLKLKTYRQYLGMQMCASMAMAIMSSYFYTYCDFFIRRDTYMLATQTGLGRDFPVATVAAAMMFVAQIIALPIYLRMIKAKGKRFSYIFGAGLWAVLAFGLFLLPAEPNGTAQIVDIIKDGVVTGQQIATKQGVPNWAIIVFGLSLGLGVGGTVFVPHSSFGDVCDVGELYFGERTEGAFSGLSNFLNTTAQAIGLAIPSWIMGVAGYQETSYCTLQEFNQMQDIVYSQGSTTTGVVDGIYKFSIFDSSVQLVPLQQSESAQLAIRIAFTLLPIAVLVLGVYFASKFKLNSTLQRQIVQANALQDKTTEQFATQREELLQQL